MRISTQTVVLVTGLLAVVAVACGGSEGPASEVDNPTQAITVRTRFAETDGKILVLSTNLNMVEIPPASLVDRPYFLAVFRPGFAAGTDAPVYLHTGRLGANLDVGHTTPAMFAPGYWDTVVVIYRSIEPDPGALQSGQLPIPKNGDLSSFSVNPPVEGLDDPAAGIVRIAVSEAHPGLLELDNVLPPDASTPKPFFFLLP